MAAESSFDIVSEFDRQELANALDQTQREIRTRYDLKDTGSDIEWEKDVLTITAPADMHITAISDLLQSKMVRRNLSLKILRPDPIEPAAGGKVRQKITLQHGLDQDKAKDLSKRIRDAFPKVKPTIQGDAVRVTAKSRDELQAVITHLKAGDYPLPLQFINYR